MICSIAWLFWWAASGSIPSHLVFAFGVACVSWGSSRLQTYLESINQSMRSLLSNCKDPGRSLVLRIV